MGEKVKQSLNAGSEFALGNGRIGVAFGMAGIFQLPGKAAMRLQGSLSGPAYGGSWVEFGQRFDRLS